MTIELENLGTVNQNEIRIDDLTLYFSYKTVVAFRKKGKMFCSKNVWTMTTGKLLNKICPDKKARIENEKFKKELKKVLKSL